MERKVRTLRILVVEDDDRRFEQFEAWLPTGFRLVRCSTGAQAMGLLQRVKDRTEYHGVMLDNDLDKKLPPGVPDLKGSDIAKVLGTKLAWDTPVLVHSMSVTRHELLQNLEAAGFPISLRPFAELTREQLVQWLDEVRERFDEL